MLEHDRTGGKITKCRIFFSPEQLDEGALTV